METWTERMCALADRAAELGSADKAVRCYALMDMRAYPTFSTELWKDAGAACWRVWQGTDLASHADIGPMLIEVDLRVHEKLASPDASQHPPDAIVPRCLARADETDTGRYAVIYLLSSVDGETLARHFQSYCEYSLPDGRAYYLHFYDARILARLYAVWNTQQKAAFMKPIDELHYRRRDGELAVWRSDAAENATVPSQPTSQALTLEQHQKLLALDYPDKVTLQLRRAYPGLLAGVSHEALSSKVSEQLGRARAHGLEDERDLFDYVSWALTTSPQFDEHPRVVACLHELKLNPTSLAAALSILPDDVWDDVAATLKGAAR